MNFDGLVGPTHNYAGLSFGNVASRDHGGQVSHPRAAALQGVAKMRAVSQMGFDQGFVADPFTLREQIFNQSFEADLLTMRDRPPIA